MCVGTKCIFFSFNCTRIPDNGCYFYRSILKFQLKTIYIYKKLYFYLILDVECSWFLIDKVCLDIEDQTLIFKIGLILNFIDAIDLDFGCLQTTEFQPSRADVVNLEDDGICDFPVSLPGDQPTSWVWTELFSF